MSEIYDSRGYPISIEELRLRGRRCKRQKTKRRNNLRLLKQEMKKKCQDYEPLICEGFICELCIFCNFKRELHFIDRMIKEGYYLTKDGKWTTELLREAK